MIDGLDEDSLAAEFDDVDEGGANDYDDDFDRDDCKIENEDIGVVGLELQLGNKTVTFDSWTAKDGEPNEYVGFSITVTGADSVSYVVKAGTQHYASDESSWANPNGTGGPEAQGISNVDFCDECEDGSCDPPEGEGEPDPECTDIDGCDHGDGSCSSDDQCGAEEVCDDGECVPYVG